MCGWICEFLCRCCFFVMQVGKDIFQSLGCCNTKIACLENEGTSNCWTSLKNSAKDCCIAINNCCTSTKDKCVSMMDCCPNTNENPAHVELGGADGHAAEGNAI